VCPIGQIDLGTVERLRSQLKELDGFQQAATAQMFIDAVETLLDRKLRAFSSAIDPPAGVVFEVFALEPEEHVSADGRG
jgi:hypothetical protein